MKRFFIIGRQIAGGEIIFNPKPHRHFKEAEARAEAERLTQQANCLDKFLVFKCVGQVQAKPVTPAVGWIAFEGEDYPRIDWSAPGGTEEDITWMRCPKCWNVQDADNFTKGSGCYSCGWKPPAPKPEVCVEIVE